MKKRSIHGLDLIRFFAALIVMIYHLGFKAWVYPDHMVRGWLAVPAGLPPWAMATSSGWIGVQIFFVISGFVIANSANGAAPYGFLAGRVRRLVPAAWCCATIALVIVLIYGAALRKSLLLWLSVIMFNPAGPWLLGQFWTLPLEIMFYALMLGLLLGDRFHWIAGTALLLSVVSCVYWIAVALFGVIDPAVALTRLLLVQYGCYFAMGMALWLCSQFGPRPAYLLTVAASLVAAVLQIGVARIGEAAGILTVPVIVPIAIFGAAIMLLWLSVRYNHRLLFLDRHAGTIRTIGLLTYPLYLIHVHVGGAVMAVTLHAGLVPVEALAAGCVAAILGGLVLAIHVEPAGQRIIAVAAARIGMMIAQRGGSNNRLLGHTQRLAPPASTAIHPDGSMVNAPAMAGRHDG